MKNNFTFYLVFLFILNSSVGLAQNFTHQTNVFLPEFNEQNIKFYDADNDGDLDILMNGFVASVISNTRMAVIENTGSWKFSSVIYDKFSGCNGSTKVWDEDSDGFVDLLINENHYNYNTIYKTKIGGGFIEKSTNSIQSSNSNWVDFDNDGFPDIITNIKDGSTPCKIFRYINGGYENKSWDFQISGYVDPIFTDVDNDGDLDGMMVDLEGKARIYLNDGKGNLSEGSLLGGFEKAITRAFPVDLNGDGGMDFVFIPNDRDMLYWMINDTNGKFTFIRSKFDKLSNLLNIKSLDIDNDGDLDLFIFEDGYGYIESRTRYLRNDGDLNFIEVDFPSTIKFNNIESGDLDGDGDIDLAIQSSSGGKKVYLLKNELVESGKASNNAPSKPTQFKAVYNKSLHLTWDQSHDIETPDEALGYDIQFYLNGKLFSSGIADPNTSYNRIPYIRGKYRGEEVTINCQDWPSGTYTCKLVAIDNQQSCSDFAVTSFLIPEAPFLEEIKQTAEYSPLLSFNIPEQYHDGKIIIERKIEDDIFFQEIKIIDADQATFTDNSADKNKSYQYRIKCNINGTFSGVSNVRNFQMGPFSYYPLLQNIYKFEWFDYNHDVYPDLIAQSSREGSTVISLFINKNGELQEEFFMNSSWLIDLDMADLDGDNMPELILTTDSIRFFKIENDKFSPMKQINPVKGYVISADTDFDGNGYNDLSILISKYGQNKIVFYKNNGSCNFELVEETLLDIIGGNLFSDDINLDGSPDLVGLKDAYINMGDFKFQLKNLDNDYKDFRRYRDVNHDDIYEKIWVENNKIKLELSNPLGEGDVYSYSSEGSFNETFKWVDYNADGMLDITYCIFNNVKTTLCALQGNILPDNKIDKPSQVTDLKVKRGIQSYLTWSAATDNQNSQSNLRYRYYILNENTGEYIVPTTNTPNTDSEQLDLSGYTTKATKVILGNFREGNYAWGVQAIDMHGQSSTYASGPNFVVKQPVNVNISVLNNQSVKISWLNEVWADSILIERANYISKKFTKVASCMMSDLEYIDNDLEREGCFIYRIRAFSGTIISELFESPVIKLNDFTLINNTSLPNLKNSKAIWLDSDSDGDMDLFLTGLNSEEKIQASLYLNDNGLFSLSPQTFIGVVDGYVKAEDINRDNFIDIVLTGKTGYGKHQTIIYLNQGDGSFVQSSSWFPSYTQFDYSVNFDFGDIDNNGTPDCFSSNLAYTNTGYYFEKTLNFSYGSNQSCYVYDFDRDGMSDIYLGGLNYYHYTYLINNGESFDEGTQSTHISISAEGNSIIDINADGWMDIIYYGHRSNDNYPLNYQGVIHYNKLGVFVDEKLNLAASIDGMAEVGDYDNNGYPDIIIAGNAYWYSNSTHLELHYYQNKEGKLFNHVSNSYKGLLKGDIKMADFDKDGDLDFVITGEDVNNEGVTQLFKCNVVSSSELKNSNKAPSIPNNPRIEVNDNIYTLLWDKSQDDTTPQDALTYNIWVQNSNGDWVVSPKSNPTTGERFILEHGNVGSNLKFTLKGVMSDKYKFAVQAVDNAYKASGFSEVIEFGSKTYTSIEKPNDGIDIISRSGQIILQSTNIQNKSELEILNIKGEVIYNDVFLGNTHTVRTSGWATGVYILKMYLESGPIVRKVFVK